MGRGAPVAVVGVALAGVAVWALWRPAAPPRLPDGTNVVVITLDTVRADRLNPYGFDGVETPSMSGLAREGVLFERAYSTAPLTFPAHASLFTGLIPPGHGVRDNSGFRLDDAVPTLAEAFKTLQYRTAAFVSAFVLDGRGGLRRGFDRYRDDFDVRLDDLAAMAGIQRTGEDTWAAARLWIGEAPTAPFFLWVHFFDAHTPYAPPEPFRSRYPTMPYEAEIAHVDALVGQVVAELERLAIADRTLIIVAGDHGEGLGDHGEDEHGLLLYDSTLQVPLVMRFPDRRYAGTRVQRAVSLVDVFPSVLDLFGRKPIRAVDGHSLLPSLAAPASTAGPVLYAETEYPRLQFEWSGLQSARSDRFKLIRAPLPELYEYRTDPREEGNRVRQFGDAVSSLNASLAAATAGSAAAAPSAADGRTMAALRALGYVAGGGDTPAGGDRLADPKDKVAAYRRLMVARTALDHGSEAEGLRLIEGLLADEPGFGAAHRTYRGYFIGRKRASDALVRLRDMLADRPGDVHVLRDIAEAHRSLGQVREALAALDTALASSPQFVPAISLAGDLLADRGQFDEARSRFERALALRPLSSELVMKLARTHIQLGQLDRAEQLIGAALAEHADVSGAHYLRALIAEQRGSGATAEAEYRREMELHPWDYQARFNLARLLGERRAFSEQIALLDSIPALAPEFGDVHFYRAKAYLDSGDASRRPAAIAAARRGLQMAPDSATAPLGHYVLADIHALEGRPQEAARELTRGRALEALTAARR